MVVKDLRLLVLVKHQFLMHLMDQFAQHRIFILQITFLIVHLSLLQYVCDRSEVILVHLHIWVLLLDLLHEILCIQLRLMMNRLVLLVNRREVVLLVILRSKVIAHILLWHVSLILYLMILLLIHAVLILRNEIISAHHRYLKLLLIRLWHWNTHRDLIVTVSHTVHSYRIWISKSSCLSPCSTTMSGVIARSILTIHSSVSKMIFSIQSWVVLNVIFHFICSLAVTKWREWMPQTPRCFRYILFFSRAKCKSKVIIFVTFEILCRCKMLARWVIWTGRHRWNMNLFIA